VATFLALCIALASTIWFWQINPSVVQKWTSWPDLLITSCPFLLALFTFFVLLNTLRTGKSETAPFIQASLIFAFSFISLAGSLHPYILPPQVTVYAAAAPALTLNVMLAVMVLMLPLMLLYNAYHYKVLRGRAGEAGYDE